MRTRPDNIPGPPTSANDAMNINTDIHLHLVSIPLEISGQFVIFSSFLSVKPITEHRISRCERLMNPAYDEASRVAMHPIEGQYAVGCYTFSIHYHPASFSV